MTLQVTALLGNHQRLDGGAMFGNAPRALWSRWCPPDELGRIELATRAALIRDGQRKVLLETGIGAFFEPKLKDRFGVLEERHVLLDSLAAAGESDASIDVVVVSHLHFDHAGGLLAPYRAGDAPRLLFPNATFVVSRAAFERAKHPHPRDKASFVPELPTLLEGSGRLELVDTEQRNSPTLGPAFEFVTTHGHTPGMLHCWLRGQAQNLFYCADLIPGRPWVHAPITMGYDRHAEALIDEKSALLERFAKERTWLFFTHDAEVAMTRVVEDDGGRFRPDTLATPPTELDLDERFPD